MTAARIVIVAVLLPLAIAGALVLSAAATMNLFSSQGVTVAWAAVGMLEVTSLAGTLLWVLVANPSLRRDAILVTCAATGVALVAGVFAYGPVGAVAGVLLVALTHLASRAWREPWAEPRPEPVTESRTLPEQPRTVQDLVEDHEPFIESEEFTQPAPVRTLAVARDPEDERRHRARELVANGAGRGTVSRALGISPHQARELINEVKQA